MLEYIGIIMGIIALLVALYLTNYVKKQDIGTEKMKEICEAIHEGAMTFLNREYKTLTIFIVVVAILLSVMGFMIEDMAPETAITFVLGAVLSALAGNIGMRIATAANARTAKAVEKSTHDGLKIAFSSGAVMGLSVVGLGLIGVSAVYLIFQNYPPVQLASILFGFSFGASSIALFARVGGGIYTKAADVGADLVGKVEAGIPEDDPRNPATIADNVGDNVGDVAGMGADLYESYVGSIVATIAISMGVGVSFLGDQIYQLLPIILAGLGIVSSIIGIFIVNLMRNKDASKAMNTGLLSTSVIMFILSLIYLYLTPSITNPLDIALCMLLGIVVGVVIGFSTEYYTSDKYKPTQGIAEAAKTGAATAIIEGMAVGMYSTIIPVLSIAFAMVGSYILADIYGIAIAAVGLLSTLGMTLAMDAYGPVADNAAGIAEMAGLGLETREKAEALDAVGNTTAAIGKGFAIGSAALTALAFFVTYGEAVNAEVVNLLEPNIVVGIFIGALLPFVFSSMTMKAVGRAAMHMVEEVRRQFKEIPGIMEGTAKPDYAKCVDISVSAALKEMIVPTLLAILTPIAIGIILGPVAVCGLLVGAISTGFLMAIFMANTGGALDNAKKYVESGKLGGKGSDVHKATVVGDTIGDPLKDTSGPSLNILIKLMSIVALLFAPLFLLF